MRSWQSKTVKAKTACGDVFLTFVFGSDGQIVKLLGRHGRSGGCGMATTEAACRLCNAGLRGGMYLGAATVALRGIACHASTAAVPSCMDAIGAAIAAELDEAAGGLDEPFFEPAP